MCGLHDRNLFSQSSGDWNFRIQVPSGSGSGESSPADSQLTAPSLHTYKAEGKRSLFLFSRGHSPTRIGTDLMTSFNLNYPLKTLPPDTVTQGVRASEYKFLWAGWNSIHSTVSAITSTDLGELEGLHPHPKDSGSIRLRWLIRGSKSSGTAMLMAPGAEVCCA